MLVSSSDVGKGSIFVTNNLWKNKHDYNGKSTSRCVQSLDAQAQSTAILMSITAVKPIISGESLLFPKTSRMCSISQIR
jgi:hypothetical protein